MAQAIPTDEHTEANAGAAVSRVAMDGTYTIRDLPPGDYTVVALLPGYTTLFDGFPLDASNPKNNAELRARLIANGIVSVRSNETVRFDTTIQRGATISGRVLYDDGAPATQAVLDIENVNTKAPAKKSAASGTTDTDTQDLSADSVIRSMFLHQNQVTDDQGNFRISGIRPGTYRIFATPPGIDGSSNDEQLDFMFGVVKAGPIRIYSGDTSHRNAAKTYDLKAGDEVSGIEITVPVYAFHRVEGHLTSLDGRPIIVAAIALTDSSDDSFVLHSHPARDGEFFFPAVPSGTYKLAIVGARLGELSDNTPPESAILQNAESFADTTTSVIVKDSDITDLNIQLQKAPSDSASTASQNTAQSSPAQSDPK